MGFHQDNPQHSHQENSELLKLYLKNIPNPTNIKILNHQQNLNLRKKSVIPAAEPGSSRRDLGSSRFALDRDDKITKFWVNPKNIIVNNNPNLKLDVSSFIKADAMLKITQILKTKNIYNNLINIGGDILANGQRDYHNKWVVAVKLPDDGILKLPLNDQDSVATSGIYARFKSDLGNEITDHHIFNPKTGKSAKGFYSVTVIHKNPYIADAAATAILAAGLQDEAKVINNLNIDKYLLIKTSGEIIVGEKLKYALLTEFHK
jgi:thiamine biosynthesis lipoprotein ApbE